MTEQVQENKEQIAKHWNVDRVLADFGIKMLGRFDSYDDIKDFDEGENYGNAYLIGTEEPYDVYVWTRADVNAGQPEPYWLDIGPISLVGPQGPEGPAGEKGDTGERGSKWFSGTNNRPAVSGTGVKVNDQFLNTLNGEVYQLIEYASGGKGWSYTGNIRGPQGIQGEQGPEGPRGPQGEPGPQGERGDVGGFINIWGILTQSSQLPTPSSLNNMTVAYLVGTTMPYDLWIQVGENSATANWQNTGPFNAATAVTSGGVYQNVWDADTKLDKISTSGSYQQAYVKNANGTQGMMNITTGTAGSTLVQRASDGNISVTYPNNDSSATSRAYVNEKFVAKPTDTSGFNRIVGVNTNNTSITYKVQYPNYNYDEASAASRVGVPYMEQGQIACSIPTSDYSAANKKYVDDGFVARQPNKDSGWNRAYGMTSTGEETIFPIANGIQGGTLAIRGVNGRVLVGAPVADNDATTKEYVDNLFVQARFNFTSGSNYILINIYMKKSDYDAINSIEDLSAYLTSKGAKSGANTVIIHMGERGNNTAVTDIIQYIYAPTSTRFTMIGYTRASGAAVYIESSTLTYSSKSYVSL